MNASQVNPANDRAVEPATIEGVAFMDGEYIPASEAKISVFDWGFARGDAVFDVAHVWKGWLFRVDDHLERFAESVAKFEMTLPYELAEIREIVIECVRRSGLEDAFVEMVCTRGMSPAGAPLHPRHCVNNFFAYVFPFLWIVQPDKIEQGAHVVISSVQRIPPESIDPTAKNFNRLDLMKAMFEAYNVAGAGAVAVLPDRDGNITEGSGFNVMAAIDGKVVTPARGVLEGITRRTALELCDELGIPNEEGVISAEELRDADEVFLTSSAGGIMPVTRVDERILGNGAAGPLTRQITDLYWAKKEAGWLGTRIAYD